MSHAPAASIATGVVLFWASLVLYTLLRIRAARAPREVKHGPP